MVNATPSTPEAIVFFAHGSRDPLWHQPIEAIAAQTQALSPQTTVRCAYLELTAPTLTDCVAALVQQGLGTIAVVPLFLGVGRHVRDDLPLIMSSLTIRFPQTRLVLQAPIGENPQLIKLVAHLALGHHVN
jgi:sirohydrochlorin cobaltochelatase